jgi:hypothetical protein
MRQGQDGHVDSPPTAVPGRHEGSSHDSGGNPGGTTPSGCEVIATYTYEIEAAPPCRFEHDPAARVFRLTTADGTVELFRDNPIRYLCVEPDPQTGAMRPMTRRGRPVYLYLCREERETR